MNMINKPISNNFQDLSSYYKTLYAKQLWVLVISSHYSDSVRGLLFGTIIKPSPFEGSLSEIEVDIVSIECYLSTVIYPESYVKRFPDREDFLKIFTQELLYLDPEIKVKAFFATLFRTKSIPELAEYDLKASVMFKLSLEEKYYSEADTSYIDMLVYIFSMNYPVILTSIGIKKYTYGLLDYNEEEAIKPTLALFMSCYWTGNDRKFFLDFIEHFFDNVLSKCEFITGNERDRSFDKSYDLDYIDYYEENLYGACLED